MFYDTIADYQMRFPGRLRLSVENTGTGKVTVEGDLAGDTVTIAGTGTGPVAVNNTNTTTAVTVASVNNGQTVTATGTGPTTISNPDGSLSVENTGSGTVTVEGDLAGDTVTIADTGTGPVTINNTGSTAVIVASVNAGQTVTTIGTGPTTITNPDGNLIVANTGSGAVTVTGLKVDAILNTTGDKPVTVDLMHLKSGETVTIDNDGSGAVSLLNVADGVIVNFTGSGSGPVNSAPLITSTSPVSVAENTTAVTTITAFDANTSDTKTFSISGGGDKDLFTIDASTGALSFKASPDFETPVDANTNNGYEVTVKVTDGSSLFAEKTLTVNVTNVNEAVTDLALSANSIAENVDTTGGVKIGDITVTDPDSSGNSNVLSLEGTDAGLFEIRNGTELYYTGASPNFEATKNSYSVTVKATDGSLVYSKGFTVNVSDVNEAPVFTLTAGAAVVEKAAVVNQVVATYTAPTDEDNNTVTVDFTAGSNNDLYYALDTTTREVKLTAAGVTFVNGGGTLPQISLTATDNGTPTASSVQTATPTTTMVNDAPTVTLQAATATYTEKNGADDTTNDVAFGTLDNEEIADIDGDAIANLTVSFANDKIKDGENEQFLVGGSVIALNAAAAGTNLAIEIAGITYKATVTKDGTNTSVLFENSTGSTVTKAQAEALLDALHYNNASNTPTNGDRIFNLTVSDGSAISVSVTKTITVTGDVSDDDSTPPTMQSASVTTDGTQIIITYSEPISGELEAGDYAVTLSSGSVTFSAVTLGTGADANKVTLTASALISSGVTVSNLVYTASNGTSGSVKDAAGNLAVDQTLGAVTNSSTLSLIYGTENNDTLSGTSANDTIYGLGGNDVITGGAGADTIDGGSGTDTANYSTAKVSNGTSLTTGNTGITLTLNGSTAATVNPGPTDVGADSVVNIENITGTNGIDTIYGDANPNVIDGGGGGDVLSGGGGGDTFVYSRADVIASPYNGHDTILSFNVGSDKVKISYKDLTGTNYYDSNGDKTLQITEIDPGVTNIDAWTIEMVMIKSFASSPTASGLMADKSFISSTIETAVGTITNTNPTATGFSRLFVVEKSDSKQFGVYIWNSGSSTDTTVSAGDELAIVGIFQASGPVNADIFSFL